MQKKITHWLKKYFNAYLFISPFFILFFVFQLYPMISNVFISFTEWNGISPPKNVGMKNYMRLFKDAKFMESTANTFYYWVWGSVLIIVFALFVALLLNTKKLRFKNVFNCLTFFPYVCATVAMGLIFNMLFDYNAGLINELLNMIGLKSVGWLTSTSMSKVPPLILYIWRFVPWFTMIILSGLCNIPAEYYEAATVDGANIFQQFWKITLPSLTGILFFCMITVTAESWKIFSEPFIMMGPATSNTSLFQYMHQNAFILFKMGYGAAISNILTIILMVFSLIQFYFMRRSEKS